MDGDLKEALDALQECVLQEAEPILRQMNAVRDEYETLYRSCFTSHLTDAMRVLVKYGRAEIVNDRGDSDRDILIRILEQ